MFAAAEETRWEAVKSKHCQIIEWVVKQEQEAKFQERREKQKYQWGYLEGAEE
jgi:hypothetical protein